MPADVVPGDAVQISVGPPRYKYKYSVQRVDLWTIPIANTRDDRGQVRHLVGSMDVHDIGLVLAVLNSEAMNWCLVVCQHRMGWTLAAFLEKVPC